MEILTWLYHHWIFLLKLVFAAIVTLVVWVLFFTLFDFVKAKAKIPAYLLFAAFLVLSPIGATAVKNWATDAYHVAIDVPQHYESQEEVDMRWAGFGHGMYWSNWVFWGLAVLFSALSLFSGKQEESDAEEKAKESESQASEPPDSDS